MAPEAPTVSWNSGAEPQHDGRPGQHREEVEREEPDPAERQLELRPDDPQREHVEADVEDRDVREPGGHDLPVRAVDEPRQPLTALRPAEGFGHAVAVGTDPAQPVRAQAEQVDEPAAGAAGDQDGDPDRDVDRDQHARGGRGVGGAQPAERGAPAAGGLLALGDAARALEAHRRVPHAVRTDRSGRSAGSGCTTPGRGAGSTSAPRSRESAGRTRSAADDLNGLDHDRVDRAVARAGRGGADRVDDVARGLVGDLTEDGVLEVQPRGRADGDEEL